MSAGVIAARIFAAGSRAAARAVAARQAGLVAALADAVPEIVARAGAKGVTLAASGLRARVFGTRLTPRDIRLLAIVEEQR